MYKYILVIAALIGLASCQDIRIDEHKDWARFFEEEQVKGAIEYIDNNTERVHYYDMPFNSTQMIPGGAFQIFASLVSLESAVARTEAHEIKWNGKYYAFSNGEMKEIAAADTNQAGYQATWAQDLTLLNAFKHKSIPYFQELVGQISIDEMRHYMDTVKYGNRKIDTLGINYWNDGTLKISPDEQVGLIKRLYHSEIRGFTERSQRIVRGLFDKVTKENYSLYYKSYTTQQGDTAMVQYIGYVEKIKNLKNPKTNEIDPIPHPYFFVISVYDDKSNKELEAKAARVFEKVISETDLKETFDNF